MEAAIAMADAIITKKLSSLAFYKYGLKWDDFMKKVTKDFSSAIDTIVE